MLLGSVVLRKSVMWSLEQNGPRHAPVKLGNRPVLYAQKSHSSQVGASRWFAQKWLESPQLKPETKGQGQEGAGKEIVGTDDNELQKKSESNSN